MEGVPSLPHPTVELATCGWKEELGCVTMVAMVAVLVWGLLVVARAVARAHLVCLGCCSRVLRRRVVECGPFGQRGGGDGRGGGERRALHDPIFLKIVEFDFRREAWCYI